MPDDSRFNGISDKLGEGDEETAAAAVDDESDHAVGDHEDQDAGDDLEDVQAETSTDATPSTVTDRAGKDSPAFEFEDTKQGPLYARPDSWEAFEDALDFDVAMALRDYDVRDVRKSELHDAALRVASDHPEEIATQLLRERGMDVDAGER